MMIRDILPGWALGKSPKTWVDSAGGVRYWRNPPFAKWCHLVIQKIYCRWRYRFSQIGEIPVSEKLWIDAFYGYRKQCRDRIETVD